MTKKNVGRDGITHTLRPRNTGFDWSIQNPFLLFDGGVEHATVFLLEITGWKDGGDTGNWNMETISISRLGSI